MAEILVCDDDKAIVEAIDIYLTQEGHHILKAYDGEEAIQILNNNPVDLLVIDIMMPKLDGIRATLKIREKNVLPIIILSAKSEDADKILGLNVGADDYVTKPFNPLELVARVKAVLRRYQAVPAPAPVTAATAAQQQGDYVEYPDLIVNLSNYAVLYQGKSVDMPPKELELLYFLASSPNQVFTREQLLDHIWGYEYIGDTRTVDVHIKRLREKIKDNDNWALPTVWGIGYKFEVKP